MNALPPPYTPIVRKKNGINIAILFMKFLAKYFEIKIVTSPKIEMLKKITFLPRPATKFSIIKNIELKIVECLE